MIYSLIKKITVSPYESLWQGNTETGNDSEVDRISQRIQKFGGRPLFLLLLLHSLFQTWVPSDSSRPVELKFKS